MLQFDTINFLLLDLLLLLLFIFIFKKLTLIILPKWFIQIILKNTYFWFIEYLFNLSLNQVFQILVNFNLNKLIKKINYVVSFNF